MSRKPGTRLPLLLPGLQLPSQPLRRLLPVSLLGKQIFIYMLIFLCYLPFSANISASVEALSALTLLVECQEEHLACKNGALSCWCGYFSGARCRLFHGPADATAIPKSDHLLPGLKSDWFYLSGTALPRLSWKRGC